MEDEGGGYRWETGYEKTWEAITEDGDGLLEVSVQDVIHRARRKRLAERQGRNKLGMMRHLYLLIDLSECMGNQDLKPTRLHCTIKLLESFIDEYFYLNPISQLGIVTTSNKRAEKVSEMTGNPRKHTEVLRSLSSRQCSGEPSLQNSLELILSSLKHMPPHASREVIIIMGSLTTCDPGDIGKTIEAARQCKVRVSVINLSAEVRVYKELAKETGGLHNVILDDLHFKDLLASHLDPPASSAMAESSLIRMGFPSHAGREGEGGLGMCLCHLESSVDEGRRISTAGYCCPQCSAKYCELPVECRGCGLTLVSAPHLARSYHHLFPLPPFVELPSDTPLPEEQEGCAACGGPFPPTDSTHHQCPKCQQVVCTECDLFIHETLHVCPGCAGRPSQRATGSSHQHTNGNGAVTFNGVG